MTTKATDISLVLSGGSTNISPNDSLGGQPSSSPVTTNVINNLFDDVDSDEARDGGEDYRCLYVFNDGDTDIWNFKLWIYDDFDDGSTLEIGIEDKDEVQRIIVTGSVTGGSLELSYDGHTFDFAHDSDLSVWADNLQTALDELMNGDEAVFRQVTVTGQNSGSDTIIFDVRFSGKDGKRSHPPFEVSDNNLTPDGLVSVTITTTQPGSPVNTVASEINEETTPPGGVGFFAASQVSPILIPRLKPDDGFPFWVKRVTPANTEAKENDGFKLRLSAESLET